MSGWGRGYPPLCVYQGRLVWGFVGVGVCKGLLLRCWLQVRWASWTLFQSSGSPPLETGIISSTSGAHGWVWWSVLSTGWPHRAQVS